jgi:hypothetical protein
MLARAEIIKLQAYKELLLAESSVNRGVLALQFQQLKRASPFGRPASELLELFRPAAFILAPIAGYFLIRRWRAVGGLWRWGVAGCQLAKKAWKVWGYLRPFV